MCVLAPSIASAQSATLAAELDYTYQPLDLSETNSGILANRRPLLVDPGRYDGVQGSQIQATQWKALHYQLRNSAASPSSIPQLATLDAAAAQERAAGRLPLALTYRPYDYIAPADIADGTFVRTPANQLQVSQQARQEVEDRIRPPGSLYNLSAVFAGTVYHHVLEEELYAGGAVVGVPTTFRLPTALYLAPTGTVTNLRVDLGDGGGYRPLTVGADVVATYGSTGRKTIRFSAIVGGQTLTSITTILVTRQVDIGSSSCAETATNPAPSQVVCNVTPRSGLSFDPVREDGVPSRFAGSRTAKYHYAVYLAPNRTALTKPVLVLDGIDPGEVRVTVGSGFTVNVNPQGFDYVTQRLLNAESSISDNFYNRLRDAGYDVVVLTYDQSKDYVQRNGRAVVDLIERLDAELASNGAAGRGGTSQVESVIGFSMGGLVGRYALAYMESPGYLSGRSAHGVRLFVSYDAPQQGANVPISTQIFLHEVVNNLFTNAAIAFTSIGAEIRSPAIQQLLAYWAYGQGLDVTTTVATRNPLRVELYDDLRALQDYPQRPRRVAVTNGATNGTGQRTRVATSGAMAPGAPQLHIDVGAGFLWGLVSKGLRFKLYAANHTAQTDVYFRESTTCILICFSKERRVRLQTPAGYDSAPGGYQTPFPRLRTDFDSRDNLFGVIAYLSPLGFYALADIQDSADGFSFIPTVSAADYNATSKTRSAFLSSYFDGQVYTSPIDPAAPTRTPFQRVLTTDPALNYGHTAVTGSIVTALLAELATTPPPPTPAPLNFRRSNPTANNVPPAFAWDAPAGATPTSYRVYRRCYQSSTPECIPATPWRLMAVTTVSSRTFTDASITAQTSGAIYAFQYHARAVYSATESVASNVVAVNGKTNPGQSPSVGDSTASELSMATSDRQAVVAAPLPEVFAVLGTRPNPAQVEARLRVDLPEPERLRVSVYDVTGRLVLQPIEEDRPGGHHLIGLDVRALPSGTYVYRVEAGTAVLSGTFAVVR
ncbi:T9SS type A sorting domain-containing protein [Rubrivirga sp.]|uniref:T9SS type A sorting domain-containing protein n=1 Tax=Rubrivirga sp. TaxID=1885344 RepID=UPI003B51AE8C